ncbi:MAG: hypothetical protein JKY19_06965 [Alcanivoracaceae bacterium]|nr:hypothetical protein [Alcanivoracaceae bacterium]
MSQTNRARYKYNPDEMSEDDFLSRFVVRGEVFDEIFEDLQAADYSVPNQHHILIGQRGQGKTTILRKLKLAVEKDKKLTKFLIPVKFAEEQYRIRELSRLWEEVAEYLQIEHEDIFPDIHDQLEQHFEDENYHTKSFGYLEKALKQSKKKILLLIDNIDVIFKKLKEQEQHRLREILLTSCSFIIVGASTKMFEQQYDYSKPFYEFFKNIYLEGLTNTECIALLKVIGDRQQTKKIEQIINKHPARIETLRRITGGVPRTIVMLFDIFIENNGNAFDDLMKVLDDVTPLYLERMNLPAPLQDIVDALAMNWDGMLTKEIAKKTRLASKVVSAQLKQLEKHQIIDSISTGKNKIYSIKERFFNIWYLMRYGRKKDRDRVEWLVKFLLSWYDRHELESKAKSFIKTLTDSHQNESYIYHFGEALSYTGLELQTEHNLKQSMKNYFNENKSSFAKQVSQSDMETLAQAINLQVKGQLEKAIKLLINSKKESSTILALIATFLHRHKDLKKAEKYYLKAIESGYTGALNSLAWLYFENVKEMDKSVDLIEKSYKLKQNYYNTHTLAIIELWAEDFSKSYEHFIEWLAYDDAIDNETDVIIYLNLLMAKGQFYQAKEFFEIAEYQLKERYKPIWYALMALMQDDFPHEIKKMGSELKQTVDEVLEEINELKHKYTLAKTKKLNKQPKNSEPEKP